MVRVVDMAGPAGVYGTRLLVEAGHEVIRVEPPAGDAVRRMGPYLGETPGTEHGAYHQFMNAGKRSLSLEVGSRAGREVLERLLDTADALVATMPLPASEAALVGSRPRLVLTVVEEDEPELCTYARSGLLSITGQPGERPTILGGHLPYAAVGSYVGLATAAALLAQQQTGTGGVVRVSVAEALTSLFEQAVVTYESTGVVTERRGYRGAITAVSGAFRCADGYWMASVPHGAAGWGRFLDWVQDPELAADPSLFDEGQRHRRRDFILDRIEAWAAERAKDDVVAEAQARHVPASPVATPLDLVHDPQLEARGFLAEAALPEYGSTPFPVGAIAAMAGRVVGPAPRLGQDNAAILTELGYTPAEHQALVESGVV